MKTLLKARLVGDQFLKMILAFRTCYIGGRYGGGKTLLAVALSYWLLGSGHVEKIVSNIPVELNNDDNGNLRRSAIILDESWLYINDKKSVVDYSAYLRKIDSYLLLPSVYDIHYRLGHFMCERLFNLQNFGIPVWIYRWMLSKGRTKDKGYFYLVNPQTFYGRYDTKYIPFDDEGISKRLRKTINEFRPINKPENLDNIISIGSSDTGNHALDDVEDTINFMVENMGWEVEDAVKKIKSIKR